MGKPCDEVLTLLQRIVNAFGSHVKTFFFVRYSAVFVNAVVGANVTK